MSIVRFESEKVSRWLDVAFRGFEGDPPDSDYQRGFLAAQIRLYEDCLGKGVDDDRMAILKRYSGEPPQ